MSVRTCLLLSLRRLLEVLDNLLLQMVIVAASRVRDDSATDGTSDLDLDPARLAAGRPALGVDHQSVVADLQVHATAVHQSPAVDRQVRVIDASAALRRPPVDRSPDPPLMTAEHEEGMQNECDHAAKRW